MLPNDALRTLGSDVEKLIVDHDRWHGPEVDPDIDQRLPWIGRSLEEAASSLEAGLDPSQVSGGLRTLIQTVRDPVYMAAMDRGYPGIIIPLQHCMGQLGRIVDDIEEA